MHPTSLILTCLAAALGAASSGACVEHDRAPLGQLALAVAPLQLEEIGNACYDVAVRNAAAELVWSRGDPTLSAPADAGTLCSSQFGNGGGGDIAYVGPCDATEPSHNVTIWVDSLWASTSPFGPLTDWTNPCPYAASGTSGCTLAFTCQENEDVAVTFNLVVMRQARQGFFDLAVNFENIFCSAKVDCTYPIDGGGEQNIELVFDPATGERIPSLVFAFACTDGDPPGNLSASDENATHLYVDDLVLACGATNYTIDPAAGVGNLYPDGIGAPAPLRQAMVFRGRELITNNGQDADKYYWNVALGWNSTFFDGGTPTCHLVTRATASHGPLVNGATPFNTDYPYVDVNVTVNSGANIVCTQHPLGGAEPHDGVRTSYTGLLYDGTRFAEIMLDNEGAPSGGGLDTHPVTWLQVSAGGRHTCARGNGGAVQCWGWNLYGQVPPPAGAFAAVASGGGHTCALRASGAVECWGLNDYGQATAPAGNFIAISGGGNHNCGVLSSGSLACWGQDLFGQSTPPAGTFASVEAGGFHSCGINAGGTLECWGYNANGQATPPGGTFSTVSAGGFHSCGIDAGGAVHCWGLNDDGQATPPGGTFVAVSAGYFYTCALASGGTVQCWGLNNYGQASPPAGVFTAISAGGQHACAMTAGGEIQCWGQNWDGQTIPP